MGLAVFIDGLLVCEHAAGRIFGCRALTTAGRGLEPSQVLQRAGVGGLT